MAQAEQPHSEKGQTPLSVSVIIVSHGRPGAAYRTIQSLRHQTFRNFEIILVSDSIENLSDRSLPDHRAYSFDRANISMARNLGIKHSSGEIVAFCDDDAIPEPTWLEHLIAPFHDTSISACGGYVRGRNGIDFQWQYQEFDIFGDDQSADAPDSETWFKASTQLGQYPKLQGTNCGFRTHVIAEIGGFDENFQFFLDETDLVKRLIDLGHDVAISPLAEVQHGFFASSNRASSRAPKSLYEIGRSKSYFLAKHAPEYSHKDCLGKIRQEQHQRLIRFLTIGWLEPSSVNKLLQSFDVGLDDGKAIGIVGKTESLCFAPNREFVPQNSNGIAKPFALCGSILSKSWLTEEAITLTNLGHAVTIFQFSFSAFFHKRRFNDQGYWEQIGGVWGRSQRTDPVFRLATLKKRAKEEVGELKPSRHFKTVLFKSAVSEPAQLEKT